jgi:hypothetical protein
MIIPETFQILGETYTVELKKNPRNHKHETVNGVIWYDRNLVQIKDSLPVDKQEVTFLHEVIHGVLRQMSDPRWDDEELIDRLSRGIYQVLESAQGDVHA